MTRRPDPHRFEVTGPLFLVPRPFLSEGAALTYAQSYAEKAETPGTWYVREWSETTWRVERDEDGIVTTKAAGS